MSGKNKTPGVLPKRKPKTSTNRQTGATRGAGDDAEYMRKAAAANMMYGGKVKKMEDGGNVISDADKNLIREKFQQPKKILGESGKSISNADREKGVRRPKKIFGESGKTLSDADRKKIVDLMGMEDGGEVRGMGRAYQGKPRACKVR